MEVNQIEECVDFKRRYGLAGSYQDETDQKGYEYGEQAEYATVDRRAAE
jgi:hypothetical protein